MAEVPGRLSMVASSGGLVPGPAPGPAVPVYLVGDLVGYGTLSETGLRPMTNKEYKKNKRREGRLDKRKRQAFYKSVLGH